MSLALVRSFLPNSAHFPFLHISYYSLNIFIVSASSSFAITLVSASSSCFTLTVPMREVSCVGSPFPAVHAKWSLVSRSFATALRLKTPLSFVYNNNNDDCMLLLPASRLLVWRREPGTAASGGRLLPGPSEHNSR